MSRFSTAAQSTAGVVHASDERNRRVDMRWNSSGEAVVQNQFLPGVRWSGARMTGGGSGMGGPFNDDMAGARAAWGVELRQSGGQQHKVITGTTRDSTSATLANCIVQGFVTDTDAYVGEATSDNAGDYRLPTRETGAHYLVAYKAGSPDVMGTTVNTIVPT